jgi:hypothetical protein
MVITDNEIPCRSAGSTRNAAFDFGDDEGPLDSGELLTGTPTIVEVSTSALTISNKVVSTAELTINGRTVAIGEAVQCSVTGGTAGTTYTIRVTVDTDSTPAQTIVRDFKHTVE